MSSLFVPLFSGLFYHKELWTLRPNNLTDVSAGPVSYIDSNLELQTIHAGSSAIVDGKLFNFGSWTQYLVNPTAPATQTTASLPTGTYYLWMYGSGSATLSAGTATITGAGTATQDNHVKFVVTVAGTVTVTVSGSVLFFQLANIQPTPFFNTGATTITSRAGTCYCDLTDDKNLKLKTALYGTDGTDAAAKITFDWRPYYDSSDAIVNQTIFKTGSISVLYDDTKQEITINDGTTTETLPLSSWSAKDLIKFKILYGTNNPLYPGVNKIQFQTSIDGGVSWNCSAIFSFDGALIAAGDTKFYFGSTGAGEGLPWDIGNFKAYDIKSRDWITWVSDDIEAYGVRWNYDTDTMQPIVLVAGNLIEANYVNFPVQEQMVRGLLTSAGNFTLLNPSNSNYLGDGVTLANLDGSDGQVMVRIPKFNTLCFKENNYRYCLISENSFSWNERDSWIPPIFGEDDCRYIGAFQGVAATDSVSATLKSIVKNTSGYTTNLYPNPFSNRTRAQFRAQMEAGFFPYCWGLYEVVWMLFLTEYKTWNSQSVLPGYTDAPSLNYAYMRRAGRTLSLGNASGCIIVDLSGVDADLAGIVASGKAIANSYRGIENPFGGVYQFIDGINIDSRTGACHVYVCHDPTKFADDTMVNYIDTGHAPGFGDVNNYINDMAFLGKDCTFYPAKLGGTQNTRIPDYHYNTAGGWRVLRAGGNLSSGALAGLGCLSAAYASPASGLSLSARSAA